MKKNALVIGRFQPVHNGHVEMMKEIDSFGLEKILLGIGIEGKGRTARNPFYYEEIKEMWLPILRGFKTAFEIYGIPDINNPPNYAEHVEKVTGCRKEDTTVVSGNRYTLDCFANYESKTLEKKIPLGGTCLCASIVRELIREGKEWEKYVPESSRKLIRKTGIDYLKGIISEELIYDGHLRLVKRPYNGVNWDIIVSKNAAAIMYIDEEDNVWFTKQYRVPLGKEILELPAETLDKPGLTPLEVMVEGLEEECGIKIDPSQVHYFGEIESSGGHDTEMVYLFYAHGPNTKTQQRLEDTEKIEVVRIPFYDAYDMIAAGEIQGSKTIALLQHEYIKRLEKAG